jgi:hypothetical protein
MTQDTHSSDKEIGDKGGQMDRKEEEEREGSSQVFTTPKQHKTQKTTKKKKKQTKLLCRETETMTSLAVTQRSRTFF